MPNTYCIYLRKSRQDLELEAQGGEDTLARHRRTLVELAAARSLPVGAIYEEVVSGDTIAARPQMQRLLREVERGDWRGVIVMEIERLARGDSIDQGTVARAFKLSETLIITPMKTYDPSNEFDEEYLEFGLFMSRREYKTIRRRLTAGVQAARREGKYTAGQPPFGYQKIKLKGEKGGSLIPDPETAPIVRDIFTWFVDEGATIGEIKNRLNTIMPPLPSGKPRWYDRRVSSLIRNPHYAGYTTSSRRPTQKTVVDGKIKTVRKVCKDVKLYEGRHEPLIPREKWHRAQEIAARNFTPPVPRGKGQQNAFTGLIVCAECGRKMQRTTFSPKEPNRAPIIFCILRSRCTTISHRYDEVERIVLETLHSWLAEYAAPEDGTQTALADSLRTALKKQTQTLGEIEEREARAFNLVERGIYTPEIFVQRKQALEAERLTTIRQRDAITAQLAALSEQAQIRREFLPKLQHVLDAYPQTENAHEKHQLLKTVIDHIEYHKTVRVTSNNPGNLHIDVFPLLPRPDVVT